MKLAVASLWGVGVIARLDPSCSANSSCTVQLQNAIAACSDACVISLSPGMYAMTGKMMDTRILVDNKTDIHIVGYGAKLVFDDISNFFSVYFSNNVVFEGFAVDMLRQPYTFGTLSGTCNGSGWDIEFNETQYPYAGPGGLSRYPWLLGAQGVLEYDTEKQRPAIDAVDIYALSPALVISYSESMPGQLCLLDMDGTHTPPVGTAFVVRHQTYSFNAFYGHETRNLSFLNVTIFSAAGMGIVCEYCSGISLEGVAITRVEGRPMSITADGSHFTSCHGGDVTIRDSLFEGQGDDGLNVPSLFQAFENISADGRTVAIGGRGDAPIAPIGDAGDVWKLYSRHNFSFWGEATVESLGGNTVTFASPLPPHVQVYDLGLNTNYTPASVTVERTTFRNNRARGALLKADNVLVSHCIFDGNSGPAAQAIPDGCYWFEGHAVHNWTFTNNVVNSCNYGPAKLSGDVYLSNCAPTWNKDGHPTTQGSPEVHSPMHTNVTIVGNTFSQDQGQSALSFYAVAGVLVSGNAVFTVHGAPQSQVDFAGYGVVDGAVDGTNTCGSRPSAQCVEQGF